MKKCIVLFCLITLSNVVSAYDVLVNGVYYNLNPALKKAIVTNEKDNIFNGSDIYTGSITIPESIFYNGNTFKVTEIGKYAFFGSKISSISLPNSIASIDDRAFFSCEELSNIDIPISVTSIGIYAFSNLYKYLKCIHSTKCIFHRRWSLYQL